MTQVFVLFVSMINAFAALVYSTNKSTDAILMSIFLAVSMVWLEIRDARSC